MFRLGSPTPVIRWTRSKPGLDLPDDHIVNNGVLTIPAARRADQDMYVCQAVNELGVAEARGRLVVTSRLQFVLGNMRLIILPCRLTRFRRYVSMVWHLENTCLNEIEFRLTI